MSPTCPEARPQTPATPTDLPAPNAFEYPCQVRYSEVGHRGLMTLPAIINAFQDCSIFQSEMLGLGAAWLKHEARAWVLVHWQIVVDRYPSLCEPIAVGTFATSFRGVQGMRSFYLRDESGRLIVRGNSAWAFMDLERGRPARPSTDHVEPYGTAEPFELPAESRHIPVPEQLEPGTPLTVGPSLIDTNEHVNNCHYVQMALEQLPLERIPGAVRERGVREVRADYRRAAVLGDVIVPCVAIEAERVVTSLADENGAPYAVVELR